MEERLEINVLDVLDPRSQLSWSILLITKVTWHIAFI